MLILYTHKLVVTVNVVVTKQNTSIRTGAECMLENRCTCSTRTVPVYVKQLMFSPFQAKTQITLHDPKEEHEICG